MNRFESSPGGSEVFAEEPDYLQLARNVVLRRLSLRAHSTFELRSILEQKGIPERYRELTIEYFEERGLLSDADFASDWVSMRWRAKGLARRGLHRELQAKGLDEEIIAQALDRISDHDEIERARDIAFKKISGSAAVDPEKALRRVAGMLGRKGYSSSVISRVCREVQDSLSESV